MINHKEITKELREIADRIARDDKDWTVTRIDPDDGTKKKVSIDDALLEYIEHWDFDELSDLMLESFTYEDMYKIILQNLTNEQKHDLLKKVSEV